MAHSCNVYTNKKVVCIQIQIAMYLQIQIVMYLQIQIVMYLQIQSGAPLERWLVREGSDQQQSESKPKQELTKAQFIITKKEETKTQRENLW